ncbi:MAG: HEAT repeat domain-containing protein [Planctomycetota bacterium]|nr:HEAT repeat domain-containing protein [Planctomycetota bacterium]
MSEEILEKYCQFILNKYEHIRSLDEHVTLTMKDYMPLQLGEERERLDDKRRDERGDRKEYHEDFRVWREEHTAYKEYSITPVEVWKAVKNKKIVVKGDPGSGKTTLTQNIAYTLCTRKLKDKTGLSQNSTSRTIPTDLLPLVIDLKDWAGKSLSLSEYYIRHVLKGSGLEKEIKPLIDKWLTSGRCIILFDGLDEVTQERKSLIHSLQNLTSGTHRNCHLVITTRIVGYGNELSGWQHYEVLSLRDEHIRVYVRNCLGDKSSDFLTSLKNTPQMVPLSRNPLLLHVLCFVFKKQGLILPTQRIELYHQAVHEMLKLRNPEIPESVKENVLKEIAIYFLEGKEVFEEDFLRKILRDFLKKEGERHNEDDVLKEIVDKSGLLCRFGDGRFIFLHLTFQEYMAGCYIAEKIENPSQFLEPLLFNPRFRQVIRHTAGMLGSAEDITRFIEFVLEQKPLCHDILHQPLLLAGLCIADIPEKKINPALEELGKRTLSKLWELWRRTQYNQLQDNINRVFTANIGCKWARIIINNLLNAMGDKESSVRQHAAEALGKLGCVDTDVIQALLNAMGDKDSRVRADAVGALGKLGRADADVIQALLNALMDEDLSVWQHAVEVLYELGRADPEVNQALLNALRDENSRVRGSAAQVLGNLGRADPEVIQALLNALRGEDSWVRVRVAWALGELGSADNNVIQSLRKALRKKSLEVGEWNNIYLALQRLVDIKLREGRITLSSDKDKIVLPVKVAEIKDIHDQEAQRFLKFISGFKELHGEQSGDTQNDPQIMNIVGFLRSELRRDQKPLKILDYGCGKGTLINELKNISRFMSGKYEYIGVNYKSTKDAEEQARKCGFYNRKVKPCFFTTKAFEGMKNPIKVDLIFKRNVAHEIPLKEIGRRFHYILRSLKVGGILYLLDMCVLPKAEFKSVTWEKEDFEQFFSIKGLEIAADTNESRSGIPLVVATITKLSEEMPSEKELLERAVELFNSKKLRIKKALELYEKSKDKEEATWYVFLQHQFANIQRHLDEVSKEVKT